VSVPGNQTYKDPFMYNAPINCGAVVSVNGTKYEVRVPQTCSPKYLRVSS
jgi:hypothetical protein